MTTYAQIRRPYREGSVWETSFIHMKGGMETAYLSCIATDWKKEYANAKKAAAVAMKMFGDAHKIRWRVH